MAEGDISLLPLLERDPGEVLFRAPDRDVTAAMFSAAAHRLAASLPATSHLVNLSGDRLAFAEGFAAALLNGQVSLLTSDRSAGALKQLAALYPGLVSLSENQSETGAIPHHRIERGGPGAGAARAEEGIPIERLAAIVFTSGTTGEPVGHRKPWGALASRSRDAAERFGFHKERPASIIATVPPPHMYGFETTILLAFAAPVSVWCGPAFYPADIEAALDACPAPRVLVTTPLQIRALLAATTELPPLARIISATAPLDAAMAAEAESRWKTQVHEIFGATEVGSIASRRTTADAVWTTYPHVHLALGCGVDEEHPLVSAPHAEPLALGDRVQWLDPAHFRLLGRRSDIVK
ncbi:MAG: AMP-binding protein, partial [Acetobacteraceae bacterium]